jgi:hypothetical protein
MNINRIHFYRKTLAYERGRYARDRSNVITEGNSTIVIDSDTHLSGCSHQPYPCSVPNRTTTASGIR